jgi:hypothetical protein
VVENLWLFFEKVFVFWKIGLKLVGGNFGGSVAGDLNF